MFKVSQRKKLREQLAHDERTIGRKKTFFGWRNSQAMFGSAKVLPYNPQLFTKKVSVHDDQIKLATDTRNSQFFRDKLHDHAEHTKSSTGFHLANKAGTMKQRKNMFLKQKAGPLYHSPKSNSDNSLNRMFTQRNSKGECMKYDPTYYPS